MIAIESDLGLGQLDDMHQIKTLSVITLSSFHCISKYYLDKNVYSI